MYNAVDVVNIKNDFAALKKQIEAVSHDFNELFCILTRLEYFAAHFEDSSIEDDLRNEQQNILNELECKKAH